MKTYEKVSFSLMSRQSHSPGLVLFFFFFHIHNSTSQKTEESMSSFTLKKCHFIQNGVFPTPHADLNAHLFPLASRYNHRLLRFGRDPWGSISLLLSGLSKTKPRGSRESSRCSLNSHSLGATTTLLGSLGTGSSLEEGLEGKCWLLGVTQCFVPP